MSNVIELSHNDKSVEWAATADRVPVFSVVRDNPERVKYDAEPWPLEEGAEPPVAKLTTTYDMPARPNAGLALKYLKLARENADNAASWLLETAIGSDGYDALVDELAAEEDPAVALATMRNVIQFVAARALGGLPGKA